MCSMAYVNIGKENEKVEFKKSTGELREGVISIASILNKHDSGDLYFGVKNNGDVIGQDMSDSTIRDVSQAIRANIKPPIYPVIEEQRYGDRDVIHVQFSGTRRPYLAYGIPRIRVADEDAQMDQETYREMLNARENRIDSWETKKSKYQVKDINKAVFDEYIKKAKEVGRISFENEDPTEVLNKLELLEGDYLLNAGAALFVDSGMNDLQMAKFATDEKIKFTDIRRSTGPIFKLIDVAMRYLIDAMDWRVEFNGKRERDEIPEVPIDALREAVINAFAHRLVESRQSIQIMIFKNRIEIYSPGTFPDKITPEEFAAGNKKAIRRNWLITQTLYYSKDMETFATGLMKIKNLCMEYGVKYEFQKEEYGFTVIFYRHCGEGWGWSGDTDTESSKTNTEILKTNTESSKTNTENGKTNIENQNSNTENNDTGIKIKLTETESKILDFVKSNPKVTLNVMAEKCGLSRSGIQYAVNSLKRKGKIQREGSQKTEIGL